MRLVVVLVLALALLGWFLWGLNWEELVAALRGVDLGWLGLAVVLMLGEYLVRSGRWLVIVRHVDRDVPMETMWRATAVGAALNTFLPLRGGDLVRPALVAHKRPLSFTTLMSTTVVERLFDAFGAVAAMVVCLLILPDGVVESAAQLQRWGLATGGLALVGLLVVGVMASRQARLTVMVLLKAWPEVARRRTMRFMLQLSQGLEVMGHPLRLIPAGLATLVAWSFSVLSIMATLRSLGLEPPLALGLFIAVALTASITLPQAPGFVGVFQVVMENAAMLWGVSEGVAEAESFVLWFVYVVPITVIGTVYAVREGHGVLGLRRWVLEEAVGPPVTGPPAPANPVEGGPDGQG